MVCNEDYECETSFACSKGTCVKYGILEDYEESDNPLVCKSGFVGSLIENGQKVCMPTPVLKSQ